MRLSLFRQHQPSLPSQDLVLPKQAKLSQFVLTLESVGQTIPVQVKPLKIARRFTLRVRQASRDVVLTVPNRTSLKRAQEFVARHQSWIIERLALMPQILPFCAGVTIPIRGIQHEIVHYAGQRGTVWIEDASSKTKPDSHASLPKLCVAGNEDHLARRLRDFLKREALNDLQQAVLRYSQKIGCQPTGLVLRDTRSRWGSCSASGLLSFSWRLIFAPPFVLDYLAAHEVAHLRHLNHSAKYWELLGQIYPELDRAERWLKEQGATLHLYGARSA